MTNRAGELRSTAVQPYIAAGYTRSDAYALAINDLRLRNGGEVVKRRVTGVFDSLRGTPLVRTKQRAHQLARTQRAAVRRRRTVQAVMSDDASCDVTYRPTSRGSRRNRRTR